MRVAVLVPVYNRPTLVVETLETVLAQTRAPDRLVVVDDGSEDESADVVERWIRDRKPPFEATLIRAPHEGVARARRRAVEAADGCDLYAHLDSDDLWPADFLARAVRALEERPDAGVAVADHDIVDYHWRSTKHVDGRDYEQRGIRRILASHEALASACLYRAEAYRAAQGSAVTWAWGEDTAIQLRAAAGRGFAHVSGAPVTIRQRLADQRGEAGSDAYAHPTPRLTLARVSTHFLVDEGGRDAPAAAGWERILARQWFKAGQECLRAGDPADACACFASAIRLRRRYVRYVLWWLRARSRCALTGARPAAAMVSRGARVSRSRRYNSAATCSPLSLRSYPSTTDQRS